MMSPRRAIMGAAVLLAALVVIWLFGESPKLLGELLMLGLLLALAILAGRRAWQWWQARSPATRSLGLAASLGVAASGWVVVAVEWGVLRIVGDSFAMIIVAPLLMILGFLAAVAGLAAAFLGIAVAVHAATKSTERRALLVAGGALAVLLNLAYPWALVRLWG